MGCATATIKHADDTPSLELTEVLMSPEWINLVQSNEVKYLGVVWI